MDKFPSYNKDYSNVLTDDLTVKMADQDSKYEPYLNMVSDMQVLVPDMSKWQCELMNGVIFTPYEDQEPCWFHRQMQRFLLGFRWEKS